MFLINNFRLTRFAFLAILVFFSCQKPDFIGSSSNKEKETDLKTNIAYDTDIPLAVNQVITLKYKKENKLKVRNARTTKDIKYFWKDDLGWEETTQVDTVDYLVKQAGDRVISLLLKSGDQQLDTLSLLLKISTNSLEEKEIKIHFEPHANYGSDVLQTGGQFILSISEDELKALGFDLTKVVYKWELVNQKAHFWSSKGIASWVPQEAGKKKIQITVSEGSNKVAKGIWEGDVKENKELRYTILSTLRHNRIGKQQRARFHIICLAKQQQLDLLRKTGNGSLPPIVYKWKANELLIGKTNVPELIWSPINFTATSFGMEVEATLNGKSFHKALFDEGKEFRIFGVCTL